MKEWITKRLAWIDRQFVQPPSFAAQGGGKFALSAAQGRIYFTSDGTDPRLPGGAPSPRAGLYDAPLSTNQPAVVVARAWQAERWSGPVTFPAAGYSTRTR